MKLNKKFQVLAVAGVLTVGIVGGTLAWFTSQDSTTNKFTTGSIKEQGTDGIKITEEFDEPKNMLPGDEVNKDVQIRNTASYDQFIRVKLIPKFVDVNNNRQVINKKDGVVLDTNKIELKFKHEINNKNEGEWYKGNDGYFYYIGKVGAESYTNTLLDSVTLANDAGNEYRGLGFDIDVETDSIQASHDAYLDWCKDGGVKASLGKLQNKDAIKPTDSLIEEKKTVDKVDKKETKNDEVKITNEDNLNN